MKIYNIDDINGFFDTIDKCEGNVYIVSNNGDRINLKSKISQFIAFAEYFKEPIIDDLELQCENGKDVKKLVRFITGEYIG